MSRELTAAGHTVIEVKRPIRFDRRARGKTDVLDAYSAAEAVLSERALAAPKGGDGLVESLRVLRTTRTSALRERTATINQIKAMLIAGPEPLRARYRGQTTCTGPPTGTSRTTCRRRECARTEITPQTGQLRP